LRISSRSKKARIKNQDERINKLIEEKKKLEKELAQIQLADKMGGMDSIVSSPSEVAGVKVFKGKVDAANMDELKSMGDELRNKMKSGAGILIAEVGEKVQMVAVVTDDLVKDKKLMAGKIVGDVAKLLGGGGGGRPHMATAGGKDVSKIDEALSQVEEIVGKYL
jgi:alanyl-tRNA synthetase